MPAPNRRTEWPRDRLTSITLQQLRAFQVVADATNFTKAARRLQTSQSALSRSIRQLETGVGAQLFSRSTRSVELTPEGEELLRICGPITVSLMHGIDGFGHFVAGRAGRLSVAAIVSYASVLLPGLLAAFVRDRPQVEIRVEDGWASNVLDDLDRGGSEVAITADDVDLERYEILPLALERFYAIAQRSHPWEARNEILWKDFADQQMVSARFGTSVRSIVDRHLTQSGVSIEDHIQVSNMGTLGGLVREGFGVSALPAMEFAGYRIDDVVKVPIQGATRTVGLITLRGRSLSPVARTFCELAPALVASMPLPDGVSAV
ncbi:LysR family transcriptional regulator [Mycolicibacterium tokaiense]|uniref:Probable hydrogen peroxide-inducible genes activator n=1 Tax=Mycolicibacterium tokaiense TaxID=39695 RepID=A0A378TJR9_9MYCO|nr:LysR family transcriptional regulator [Mycolicibacterium tokaiense]STZ59796.1 transcriptional regulator, LysR family [Mycolicibacterium tokaiense]